MAYESDRAIYMTSAAAAQAAAQILAHPAAVPRLLIARTIADMMVMLVSNPGAMFKASEEWSGSDDGDADLDAVEKGIRALKVKAREYEGWEGDACELFIDKMEILLDELEKMKNYRKSSGQTLRQAAEIYHHGAQFVGGVAALMSGLAAASLIPIAKGASNLTIATVLRSVGRTVLSVFKMKLKVLAAAGVILAGVNGYQLVQAQLLPGLKALPDKAPDFKRAGPEGFPFGQPETLSA
ncbi:WXG100 family type VII secretion target [Streptosporangium roseum]|uniref:WXG100 family type VII secretion target n=1 Tax=Streptosporangium roseum TaxID=2001 RepID=UPI00331A3DA0